MTTATYITARADTAKVSDFIALLKPRVMALVTFTGFAGVVLAPGHPHPFLAAVAVLCIAVAAGAAGAINMWAERETDALMKRTKNRPLPQGRLNPDEALSFGVALTILSVLLMGLALNWIAAALLAFASFFYVFIYTLWLKPRTPQNIVIGGAAGAFPPMIGWAAVTGTVSVESAMLFALIFFWTPPHFWALSLYCNEDYKRAGIPMLPVVAGEAATRRQILLYARVLSPVAIAPYFLGIAGAVYLVSAAALHTVFVWLASRVLREQGYVHAKKLFAYSIFYLFALFALMMASHAA